MDSSATRFSHRLKCKLKLSWDGALLLVMMIVSFRSCPLCFVPLHWYLPISADVFVASAFHPSYGEKMIECAETATDFKGCIVVRKGLEGTEPPLRNARFLFRSGTNRSPRREQSCEFASLQVTSPVLYLI